MRTVSQIKISTLQVDQFHPPPIPVQPPPPEVPMKMSGGASPMETMEASHAEELGVEMSETTEEILTYGDQEFYVKDIARDDTSLVTDDNIVKAIKTPSPERSISVSNNKQSNSTIGIEIFQLPVWLFATLALNLSRSFLEEKWLVCVVVQ